MIEPFGESHGLVALAKFRAHGPDMVTGTSRRTARATSRYLENEIDEDGHIDASQPCSVLLRST